VANVGRRKIRIELGLLAMAGATAFTLAGYTGFHAVQAATPSPSPDAVSVETFAPGPVADGAQTAPAPSDATQAQPPAPAADQQASPDATQPSTGSQDSFGITVMVLAPQPRSFVQLQSDIIAEAGAANAHISVSLTELGGYNPQSWSLDGGQQIVAASTYKLPLLMAEAQLITSGQAGAGDVLCYDSADYEAGWFDDYAPGVCFTRADLAVRAGKYSDNTAAHILVRYLGGTGALNGFAAAHGAKNSAYYDPNVTTTDDLASLIKSEVEGQVGGSAAQQWLYPLLNHTAFEAGIPAGAPGAYVVHKIGMLDSIVNDAALVSGAPNGSYILVVSVDGPGGDAGFAAIAQISSKVWLFEASRLLTP
jgi:beta-lactamase class A